MEITINTYNELYRLNSIFSSIKHLKLNLSFLTKEENEIFSVKLNNELKACGCNAGKHFVTYTLIVCIICSFLKLPPFNYSLWLIIPILILSGIVGKLFGLLIAKIRIVKLIQQIKNHTIIPF